MEEFVTCKASAEGLGCFMQLSTYLLPDREPVGLALAALSTRLVHGGEGLMLTQG